MRLLTPGLVLIAACSFTPTGLGNPPIDAPDEDRDGDVTIDGGGDGPTPPTDARDAAPAQCPAGYVVHGTGTYRRVTDVATWENARVDCANDDDSGSTGRTHLVVLRGEVERIGLRTTFFGPKLWIGLSDRVQTSSWRWVTLESTGAYPPASGFPWKSGQPNDSGGDDDCVVMEADGEWDDRPCDNDTEQYVCECDTYPEDEGQSEP